MRTVEDRSEAFRAIEAAKEATEGVYLEHKLPLYELGEQEPRAWLDSGGRLIPEGPHPKILFADVPIMLHLTCGVFLGPLSDEMSATEDGRRTGPA